MIPILIACLLWTPAVIGMGLPWLTALRRAGGFAPTGVALRVALAGLFGVFTIGALSALVGLFLSVQLWLSFVVLVVGWILVDRDRRLFTRLPWKAWAFFGCIVVLVALFDARGMPWYDTGLYHMQAVAWAGAGALPKGLANLYGPLGYNCSWFTFAAVLEIPPLLVGKSCFVADAVLLILVTPAAADAAARAVRRGPGRVGSPRRVRADRVVLGLMLVPLIEFGIRRGMVSSLAPDLAVMATILIAAALWVRSRRFAWHVAVLGCVAVSMKLSAAPLLAAGVAAACVAIPRVRDRRPLIGVVTACVVAGIIFLVRGIWMSGYPAYPSTLGRLASLPWVASPTETVRIAKEIVYWSRYHVVFEKVKPGTPWLHSWIVRRDVVEPLAIFLTLFVASVVVWVARKCPMPSLRLVSALAVAAVSLLFWFVAAPDVRFGAGYIYGTVSLAAAAALAGLRFGVPRAYRLAVVIVGALVLLRFAELGPKLVRVTKFEWPPIRTAAMVTQPTRQGLLVQVPAAGDQSWNAPQPATSEFDPTMTVKRTPGGRITEFDAGTLGIKSHLAPGE